MIWADVFKLICDVFLYLIVFSAIGPFSSCYWFMILIVVITMISHYISHRAGNAAVRLICGLLPFVSLLALNTIPQYLTACIILLYLFYETTFDKNHFSYEIYKYWFGFPAILVLVFEFIWVASGMKNGLPIVFGLLYLITGVIVLRRKRMGLGVDAKGSRLNALSVLTPVVGGAGALLTAYGLIVSSGIVLQVLLLPLGYLLRGIVYVVMMVGIFLANKGYVKELLDWHAADEMVEQVINTEIPPTEFVEEGSDEVFAMWQKVVIVAIAVIILAMILYFLARLVRSIARSNEEKIVYENGTGVEVIRKNKRKKQKTVMNNRQKVRNTYREFLHYARRHGITLRKQTTTADIISENFFRNNENAAALREIYIKARYSDGSDISEDEVSRAKALLKNITEGKRELRS
ncbi:MAG: hypothetical protein E7187_08025 [Erysipelotrichaceae bacterium]|nr:hypothetical protein [Erysipelotrichaceae bacterium]